MYKFKMNQPVIALIGDKMCEGMIVGCSTIDMPVIGRCWMIESTDGIFPNDVYPYQTFPAFERDIKGL